jgi:hypothetical protein
MTFSPVNQSQGRAPRVQLPGMPPASLRLQDGQRTTAKLQTISVTGGLLRVLKPLTPGAVVELMFSTQSGPVLGLAELLRPCFDAPIGLQPFRFIAMDQTDRETLDSAIASSIASTICH